MGGMRPTCVTISNLRNDQIDACFASPSPLFFLSLNSPPIAGGYHPTSNQGVLERI
jgi:hypothetical protein